MRHRAPRSAVVLALIAGSLAVVAHAQAAPDPRPNIVVIMTDDQRFDSLTNCLPDYGAPDGPGSVPCMPNVRSLLQDHGVTFTQSFVTTSVCCPSRSSFLTGLYAHDHGVLTNEKPTGGYDAFIPRQSSTIATWLQAAGYRTGLIGKYLNGYYGPQTPPGWDDWHAMFGSASSSYTNFKLVENGVVDSYSKAYHTTVLGEKAVQFVDSTPAGQPLFLYFAPHAPHFPFTPAKGDGNDYQDMSPWRPPSYDEADVGDKSPFWQSQPIPSPDFVAKRDVAHEHELETLEEVDRQIGNIVSALGPRVANTLFIFTSDNGLTWGEHRIFEKKGCEFEECMRVPLVVRYDPLTGGHPSIDSTHPVLNVDYAPTIARAAGLTAFDGMDGRSLLRLLGGAPPPDWRTAVYGENFGSLSPLQERWPPSNQLIETFAGDPNGSGFKYVESCDRDARVTPCHTTFRSFYDEQADPYELCNLLASTGCGPSPPAGVVQSLTSRLHALENAHPPTLSVEAPPPTSTTPVSVTFSGTGLSGFRCSVDGGVVAPCVSPFTPPSQTHGPHALVVLGDGPGGTAAPATVRWWNSNRIPARPSFTSTPPSPSGVDGSFSFSDDAEPGATFLCSLDGADRSSCASPAALQGLALGQHSFSVSAVDGGGNLSFPATYSWKVQDDLTPPTLAMKLPTVDSFLTSRTVTVRWSGSDEGSGIDRYDLAEQVGLSGTPSVVQSSPSSTFTVNAAASGTYCFQVTAFDREGNSKTGGLRCAAVPLDDRSLTFTGPVALASDGGAFDATVTRLIGAGSTSFTFTGRRVGVLFRRGPNVGKASISVDGGTGKVVDLYGTTAKALWWTRAFPTSGPHTVEVRWTGHKDNSATSADVAIDGVAAIAEAAPQPA